MIVSTTSNSIRVSALAAEPFGSACWRKRFAACQGPRQPRISNRIFMLFLFDSVLADVVIRVSQGFVQKRPHFCRIRVCPERANSKKTRGAVRRPRGENDRG